MEVNVESRGSGNHGFHGIRAGEDNPVEMIPLSKRYIEGSEILWRGKRNQGERDGDGAVTGEAREQLGALRGSTSDDYAFPDQRRWEGLSHAGGSLPEGYFARQPQ